LFVTGTGIFAVEGSAKRFVVAIENDDHSLDTNDTYIRFTVTG
jgi:hypothetical protein